MCPRLQDPLDIPCRQVAVQAQDTAASLARLLPALQEPSRVASLQTYGIDLTGGGKDGVAHRACACAHR